MLWSYQKNNRQQLIHNKQTNKQNTLHPLCNSFVPTTTATTTTTQELNNYNILHLFSCKDRHHHQLQRQRPRQELQLQQAHFRQHRQGT